MIKDDTDDYNTICPNFKIEIMADDAQTVTEDLIDDPRSEDWNRIGIKWNWAPAAGKAVTVCWACFSDVVDDVLEAEVTTGVAVCYNNDDDDTDVDNDEIEFLSYGGVIATGENSFTYITDDDGEIFNAWEDESWSAIETESGKFMFDIYHENYGIISEGMIVSKDLNEGSRKERK